MGKGHEHSTRVKTSVARLHPEVNGSAAWLDDTLGEGPGLSPGSLMFGSTIFGT